MSEGGGATKIPKIEIEEKVDDSDSSKKIELSGTNILLISKDGNSIEIPIEVRHYSKLINTMLPENEDESESESEDEGINEISLPNISTEMLNLIHTFLDYTVRNNPVINIPKPLNSSDLNEIFGPNNKWYADFMNSIEISTLFELINAANYLDCQILLDIGCATVASNIKGKTPEEIRNTFSIENDFSPEEEEKIREENKWVDEGRNSANN